MAIRTLASHPSIEAVKHQLDTRLFRELTAEFEGILQLQQPSVKDVEGLRVSDIMVRLTGMNIKFKCEPYQDFNAYVIPPQLNKNHPLLINWMRNWYSNDESLKALRQLKTKKLEASVDRSRARVSGFFSQVEVVIALNLGCFYPSGGVKLTGAEIAAIFLHEVGHLFGWFELMANQVTTNQALRAVKETFLNSNDNAVKIEILKEVDAALGTSIPDKDLIASEVDDESSLYAVILKSQVEKSRSELGSQLYDQRGFEYLADQFASRLGAGVHLATGLDKMYKSGWHPSYRGWFIFMISQLWSILGFTALSVVTYGAWTLLALLFGDPIDSGETVSYDRPGERFARIRRELIDSLKRAKLSKETKEKILAEIETIKKIESEVVDRWGWGAKLYGYIFPSARKARNRIQQQQQLEELANNSFYTNAAKLSTLV